jgi:hypothetical protein
MEICGPCVRDCNPARVPSELLKPSWRRIPIQPVLVLARDELPVLGECKQSECLDQTLWSERVMATHVDVALEILRAGYWKAFDGLKDRLTCTFPLPPSVR